MLILHCVCTHIVLHCMYTLMYMRVYTENTSLVNTLHTLHIVLHCMYTLMYMLDMMPLHTHEYM